MLVYQRVTKSLINRHEQCEINPSIIPLNPGWFGWFFGGFPVQLDYSHPQQKFGRIPELIINQPSTIIDHMLIHKPGVDRQPHRQASFMAVMPRQSASRAACEKNRCGK